MRREIAVLVMLFLLSACGGGIALPTSPVSAPPGASVAANPTPTDAFVPLAPRTDATAALPTTPPLPRGVSTAAPAASVASSTTRTAPVGSASPASATPIATGATARVVTVIATDPVNLRGGPDTDTALIAQIPSRAEVIVIEPDIVGTDGVSRWVHVSYGGQSGYLRGDLVGPPHAPTLATPSPTGTAIIRLVATVSDRTPANNTRVTVTARLTKNDQGAAGGTMETTWHYKTTTDSCSSGPSGADGLMSCARVVSGATKGYMVTIDVTVRYEGQTFRTSTGFTPR